MERYRNFVRLEQMKENIRAGRIDEAIALADQLNPEKIKNTSDLSLMSDLYLENGMLAKAGDCLKVIYEKKKTRRVLMSLINLSVRLKKPNDAENYFAEFKEMAADDFYIYIFRYNIDRIEGRPIEVLIESLEQLKAVEYIDTWAYELAKLYHKAGKRERCIAECNDIEVWFGEGEYVERARALKAYYNGELKLDEALAEAEEEAADGAFSEEAAEVAEETVEEVFEAEETFDESVDEEAAGDAVEAETEETVGDIIEISASETEAGGAEAEEATEEAAVEAEGATEEAAAEAEEETVEEATAEAKEAAEEIAEEAAAEAEETAEEVAVEAEEATREIAEEAAEETVEETAAEAEEATGEIAEEAAVEAEEVAGGAVEAENEEAAENIIEILASETEAGGAEAEEATREIAEEVAVEAEEAAKEVDETIEVVSEAEDTSDEPVDEPQAIGEMVEAAEVTHQESAENAEETEEEYDAQDFEDEIEIAPEVFAEIEGLGYGGIEELSPLPDDMIETTAGPVDADEILEAMSEERTKAAEETTEVTIGEIELINHKFKGVGSAPLQEDGRIANLLSKQEEDLRDYFGFFALQSDTRIQIIRVMEILLNPQIRNLCVAVTGEHNSGIKNITKGITKMMYRAGILSANSMANTDADKINNMKLSEKYEQLLGRTLVIRNAGSLTRESVEELMSVNEKFAGKAIVILTDYRSEITRLFRENRELNSVFPHRIHIPTFDKEDLEDLIFMRLEDDGYKLEKAAYEQLQKELRQIIRETREGTLAEADKFADRIIDCIETRNASGLLKNGKVGEDTIIKLADIIEAAKKQND